MSTVAIADLPPIDAAAFLASQLQQGEGANYPDNRRAIHHRRIAPDRFETMVRGDEPITLDPPSLIIERMFP